MRRFSPESLIQEGVVNSGSRIVILVAGRTRDWRRDTYNSRKEALVVNALVMVVSYDKGENVPVFQGLAFLTHITSF
jgi:hypothetical protein